jgi:hypothetical protein
MPQQHPQVSPGAESGRFDSGLPVSRQAGEAGHIEIRPLRGWQDRERFVALPYRLHRKNSNWVPPLRRDIRKLISRRHNPFFEHGDACFWLAWRDGVPVGRISAQINQLHLSIHHDETGNFGMLEAIDDAAVFAALLSTAACWLRDRGMRRIVGPYSLSINDESGVLISGFDSPPMIGMPYTPPYYAARLEAAGYRKAKDLYALRVTLADAVPQSFNQIDRITAQLRADGRLAVRFLEPKRFADEIRLGLDIYNEAWASNWGFLPVAGREVNHLIDQLAPILPCECVVFAMADGEAAAMLVTLPNINEFLADLDGRLFPIGWLKLLWRLRFRKFKSSRVVLAGVRRRYAGTAISTALLTLMLGSIAKAGQAAKIETVEFSWILEDNKRSLEGCYALGGRLTSIYRIFGKRL